MTSRQPAKRKRGIILSAKGWQRLQAAEARSTNQLNFGKSYTLQELSERTGLSPNTLARVRSRKIPVDQQTLETYFRAFDLTLNSEDYADSDATSAIGRQHILLSGQLPIDSPLYIYRPPIETLCYEALLQPSALVRLKAPRQVGKTSLIVRVLSQMRNQSIITTILSLQLADASVLSDLKRFLRWFCAIVTQNLGLPNQLDQDWDDLFGNSYNCTHYFEKHILSQIDHPIVLVIDEVDVVFDYPGIAIDFFSMLRAWYEKARYGDSKSELWQKLRIVLVYSTEVYVPLNVHQSPFNAGLVVDLPAFNEEQVQDLAQRYGVDEPEASAAALVELTGGNPYLTQLGLHHLSLHTVLLDELKQVASVVESVYGAHLRNLLWELQEYPDLIGALKRVVLSPTPVELEPLQAFKLQSKGLIQIKDKFAVASCQLYQKYFQQVFSSSES